MNAIDILKERLPKDIVLYHILPYMLPDKEEVKRKLMKVLIVKERQYITYVNGFGLMITKDINMFEQFHNFHHVKTNYHGILDVKLNKFCIGKGKLFHHCSFGLSCKKGLLYRYYPDYFGMCNRLEDIPCGHTT